MEKLENSVGLSIKHLINPLHVYCRLRDIGLKKERAKSLGGWYEKNIYNGNGGSRLSKFLYESSKLLKSPFS